VILNEEVMIKLILNVDHIDIKVVNFDETVSFFIKMGFLEKRRLPSPRCSVEVVLPGENQVVFEIHKVDDPAKIGVHHIAFKQNDKTTVEEFKKIGVQFLTENKLIADTGRTISSFKDGNDLIWQLTD
jgi:catechol-2,3-dioxygenase